MADLIYGSRDAAPEPLRALLQEREGKFVFSAGDSVELPGYEPASRVREFRENNIALTKQVEKLTADYEKFKGIDPSRARDALSKLQELEDKKLIDAGQVDQVVAQRVEKIVGEKDGRIKELSDALEAANKRGTDLDTELSRLHIEQTVGKQAAKMIRPTSLPIVLKLAAGGDLEGVRWTLNDKRQMVAVKADGSPEYSRKNANQPLEMDEWLERVVKTNPEFALSSAGGGALGNAGGAGGGNHRDFASLSAAEKMKLGRRAA